jgi:anaerobic selenocysteine-containing dehydrogenase
MAGNYDHIRDAIARVVPGCENYNTRVREPGGFYMPNPPNQGEFKTPAGKAVFESQPLEVIKLEPGRLLLTTIRSHDQFNTTIYGYDDRYRGIDGNRRIIFMNNEDIENRGLTPGQLVDITSHFLDCERTANSFAVVSYPIPRGCSAAYFPEANSLVPLDSVAEMSGTPTTKCIIVSVEASHAN